VNQFIRNAIEVSHPQRKVHYWLSIFAAIPLVVIIVSGTLLQLKKHLPWVQPTEQRGRGKELTLTMPQVLEICRTVHEARVQTWDDINRVDVRPSRGMLKVWTTSNWEIQIDTQSGEVLQVAYRRSDLIEAIHDGSWFHDGVKYGIFLPVAMILLLLWLTGIYLFVLPYLVRSRRRREL
jgi:uncharacterized iron-regulated membrane protein